MKIEFDENKRAQTLNDRGIDFLDAEYVLTAKKRVTVEDNRLDYNETRYVTYGYMKRRLYCVVWTKRGEAYRVISMRKANAREQKYFATLV